MIENAHANAKLASSINMGSNMQCIQCHKFQDHRCWSAGTQMSGRTAATPVPSARAATRARCMQGRAQQTRQDDLLHHLPHPELRAREPHRHAARLEPCRGRGRRRPLRAEDPSSPRMCSRSMRGGTAPVRWRCSTSRSRPPPTARCRCTSPTARARMPRRRSIHSVPHRAVADRQRHADDDPDPGRPVFKAGNIMAGVRGGAKACR